MEGVKAWWQTECKNAASPFTEAQPLAQVQDRLQDLTVRPGNPDATLYQNRMRQLAERLTAVLEPSATGFDGAESLSPPLQSEILLS